MHRQVPAHASATPACDGTHVFVPSVADNAVWLTAIDLAGARVWQKRLGPFASRIVVACSGCARQFEVRRRLEGKRVKCPHCGKGVLVPAGTP